MSIYVQGSYSEGSPRITVQSIAVTKLPQKTIYYEGESLDLLGVEITGTFESNDATYTRVVTLDCQFSNNTGDVLSTVGNLVITVGYSFEGTSVSTEFTLEVKTALVPWSTGPDQYIANMIDAHYRGEINLQDYWAVGDERVVHLSAISGGGGYESHAEQDVTLVLLHKGGYQFTDGSGECVFVVGMKDCLNETGVADRVSQNLWNRNAYDISHNETGRNSWASSTLLQAFPEYLSTRFKQFHHSYSMTNYDRIGNSYVIEADNYLIMPSNVEITGGAGSSEGTSTVHLEYYATSTNRIKKVNGVASDYHSRSVAHDYTYGYNASKEDYQDACTWITTSGSRTYGFKFYHNGSSVQGTPRGLTFIGVI